MSAEPGADITSCQSIVSLVESQHGRTVPHASGCVDEMNLVGGFFAAEGISRNLPQARAAA